MTFINYFASEKRETPFNLAVARVIIGFYALWKVTSYVNWGIVRRWPVYLHEEYEFLTLSSDLWYLPLERWLLALSLVAFVLGYRTRITGFVSALLLAHMSAILNMITTGGTSTTFLYPVYFLLLFALFAEEDLLSVDGLRRTANRSLDGLSSRLQSETDETYAMSPLKWSLVTLGIIYAHSGATKIVDGPLMVWVDPANLARYLTLWQTISGRELILADVLSGSVLLATVLAVGTVVLEAGFILAILLRFPITPFVIGLGAMHTGIALAMTPYFFDMYLIYLLFLPWDRVYARLASSESATIVFDANCYFCVRSLTFIKWLDINRTLQFVPGSEQTEHLKTFDIDPSQAMYVIADGQSYEGYHAFKKIFANLGIFYPIAVVMALSPVERIGTQIYDNIADNRTVHFQCAVDTQG